MAATRPKVLIVDDRDQEAILIANLEDVGVDALRVHPRELNPEKLRGSDLILLDYTLDDWPERSEICFAARPLDGLALASNVRAFFREQPHGSPTAIALHTGKFPELAKPLPPISQEHILARLNNLEWVFKKDDIQKRDGISSLASAVHSLPRDLGASPLQEVAKLMGIGEEDCHYERILDDIDESCPPVHAFTEWSHGLSLIRWLLHRILPYPTCLIEKVHVAARLGTNPDGLDMLLRDPRISEGLEACKYTGALASLSSERWWASKVELLKWNLDGVGQIEAPSDEETYNYPVVFVDLDTLKGSGVAEMQGCVRIRPDDWPPFAEPAWARVEDLTNEDRRSLVFRDDREKLGSDPAGDP